MARIERSAKVLKQFAEYLGGSLDVAPKLIFGVHSISWGFWWGVLLLVIFAFSGQTSKFIYIDF